MPAAKLWEGYKGGERQLRPYLVAENEVARSGAVLTDNAEIDGGMTWIADGGRLHFWLRPDRRDQVARALLADASFCKVERADIAALRSHIDQQLDVDRAELSLQVAIKPAAIGEEVAASTLTSAVVRMLAQERRNAYLVAAAPDLDLSADYRICIANLAAIDLGVVLAEPGLWHAESWVFVDERGQPSGSPAGPPPADGAQLQRKQSLRDRVHALRQRALLVRVRSGERVRYLRLRPDRVWLLAQMEPAEAPGRFVHRSSWHLERPRDARLLPNPGDVQMLASNLALAERQYRGYYVTEGDDLGFRILATPITLAVDLVVGPVPAFYQWLFGEQEPDGMPAGPKDP